MKKQSNDMVLQRSKIIKKVVLISGLSILSLASYGQRLYTPNGTSGVGAVTNGANSVGIGISAPNSSAILDVNGFSYLRNNVGIKMLHENNYGLSIKQTIPVIHGIDFERGFFIGRNVNDQKSVTISTSSNNGLPYINLYSVDGTQEIVNINSGGNSFFNGGNVGIGTATPKSKLHVNGVTFIGGGAFIANQTNNDGIDYNLYVKGGDYYGRNESRDGCRELGRLCI